MVDPGYSGEGPRPLVVTAERQARRLSVVDFPTPVVALTRLKVPRNFNIDPTGKIRLSRKALLQQEEGAAKSS